MAWKRESDNAGTHPAVLDTADHPTSDDRTVNEVMGFISRLGGWSASHMTDYLVSLAALHMFGGPRWEILLEQCLSTELLEEVTVDGVRRWKILEDPDAFMHIRSRKEIEWDRQRKRDNSNPALTVHVRRRDGDNCRWCGVMVMWRGRTSNRSGTYDHLEPGQPATIETMVIACTSCNSSRQDNPQWADDHPLRPAPHTPIYGTITAKFLTENGYPTRPNHGPDAKIDDHPALAGSDPVPLTTRPPGASDQKVPDTAPARPDFVDQEMTSAGCDPAPLITRPDGGSDQQGPDNAPAPDNEPAVEFDPPQLITRPSRASDQPGADTAPPPRQAESDRLEPDTAPRRGLRPGPSDNVPPPRASLPTSLSPPITDPELCSNSINSLPETNYLGSGRSLVGTHLPTPVGKGAKKRRRSRRSRKPPAAHPPSDRSEPELCRPHSRPHHCTEAELG